MLIINGASDDLIELSGDISDEFDAAGITEYGYIVTSTGAVIQVEYTGDWAFQVIEAGTEDVCVYARDTEEWHELREEYPRETVDYSDIIYIEGPVNSVWFARDLKVAHARR